MTIIRNREWSKVADSVKPDSKRRVVLPKTLVESGITYHIHSNRSGQIIFDPQVTIPASELWLFRDRKVLNILDKGMAEKELINRGSFAKYVEDAP